jgi:uncharacterized protein (TIGR02453 family)
MHLRDLTQFLRELSDNNNRPWFIMNKPRYDILREEFLEVVTELLAAVARFDGQLAGTDPKKAIFRINRDIRFSHDKTPYKTRFSAELTGHNKRRASAGGGASYYFHIDRNGMLGLGAGEYMPPTARLKAIREHVVNDATGFTKMLKNKHLRATYGGLLDEDKLQRPPKGFDAAHPQIEHIKLKSFFVWTELPLKVNDPDELVPRLARGFEDAFALVNWLRGVPHTIEETS